jgi:hypothetical protein
MDWSWKCHVDQWLNYMIQNFGIIGLLLEFLDIQNFYSVELIIQVHKVNFLSIYWFHSFIRLISVIKILPFVYIKRGHYATSRKVVGSIPDEVIGFFNWPNHSSRTVALGSTPPITEINSRNLPGGKGRLVRKADNLSAICEPIV